MEVTKEKGVPLLNEETRPKSHFGFGEFLVDVSSCLSIDAVKQLVLLFGFSAAERDRVEKDSVQFTNTLRERGLISPINISPLTEALEKVNLHGVAIKVQDSFERYHRRGETPLTMRDKHILLVKALKRILMKCYNSVKPIPYVHDVWLCVNDIFVESQIHIMDNSKSHGDPRRWSTLKSYHDVFTQPFLEEGELIILEGEPGYGKSTMLLQYAYDWCTSSVVSPLKDVNIFIVLRLKELKGVKSIYDAIKIQLPEDLPLSSRDIKDIIASDQSKVVLGFDGYDEFPDINVRDTDVEKIIQGRMLSSCIVVLTTRPACLPNLQSPVVKRYKLAGFDQNMQKKYVEKAITPNAEILDMEDLIMGKLHDNVILSDICQVPLFFVMFAHMISNDPSNEQFYSVTSYFSFMLTCFFSHLENKSTQISRADRRSIGQEDSSQRLQIGGLAFDGLSRKEQKLLWSKEEILEHVDSSCLERYLKTGILLQEQSRTLKVQLGFLAHNQILEEVNVRFFHKTFQEFYAAFYIVHLAENIAPDDVKGALTKFDLNDLQYVFRFACGLDPASARLVLDFLSGLAETGRMFSTLCILEQGGETTNSTVAHMCRRQVTLSLNDSRLLQRSKIQLLQTASQRKIPISSVCLHLCFHSVDLQTESLCLSSGMYLPRLDSLQQLVINDDHNTDLTSIAVDILDYTARCVALMTLEFVGVILPASFDKKHVLDILRQKNCKVIWYYGDDSRLNLQSGRWERMKEVDITEKEEEIDSEVAKLAQQQTTLSRNDSIPLQKSKIRILQTASERKIPISSVCLHMCFSAVDLKLESICLSTGLMLPKLDSLQALVIYYSPVTDLGERFADIISYSAMCAALKTVEFVGVLLPQSFDNKDVLGVLYRNNCEVIWYFVDDWRLNLQSGQWEDERGRQITEAQYRNAVHYSKGDDERR